MSKSKEESIETFVDESLQLCDVEARQLNYHQNVLQQLHAVWLYGTILEIASDCLDLIKCRKKISPGILLRSLCEAYADLLNTIKDENYWQYRHASTETSSGKILKNVQKGSNSYSKELAQDPGIAFRCEQITEELENLRKNGYHPLNIKERFYLVGLESFYCSVYIDLCGQCHHDLRALENRHMEPSADDQSVRVCFFKKLDGDEVMLFVYSLGDIILDSSVKIHQFLKSPSLEILEQKYEDYKKLLCD